MNQSNLNLDSLLSIGKVVSVKGRVLEILVSSSKNSSILVYNGEIIRNVSVGSYVKICKGFEELIGKIESEYIEEDKSYSNREYKNYKDKIKRKLSISLLGYFHNNVFEQGIKELPLIDNECFLLTNEELNKVHNFIKDINGTKDDKLKIGTLANESGTEISIGVNSLFASHIGIFGNTGSGKSYTLAALYHRLFEKYYQNKNFRKKAKFLIFDFNGEYSNINIIHNQKEIYNLTTKKIEKDASDNYSKLPINSKVFLNEELLIILANASDKTQKPFIKRVIKRYRQINNSDNPLNYFKNCIKQLFVNVLNMADKIKSFELINQIQNIINDGIYAEKQIYLRDDVDFHNNSQYFKLNSKSTPIKESEIKDTNLYKAIDNYKFPENFIEKLLHFFTLTLIYDLNSNVAQFEHISPAISKLKSSAKDLERVIDFDSKEVDIFSKYNLCIVNINECNIDIKKIIPLILSKNIYDKQKKLKLESNENYLNIVIDEAHNILSYSSLRESETWKDYRLETFEEIIKEGRKYGVFLTIASQRPSDISDTIISQLHNYFLHRLINNRDIQAVERTISYLDKVSFDSLPILPTGTCIFAGLSAQVPVIVKIDKIEDEYEPNNKTIRPTDFWID